MCSLQQVGAAVANHVLVNESNSKNCTQFKFLQFQEAQLGQQSSTSRLDVVQIYWGGWGRVVFHFAAHDWWVIRTLLGTSVCGNCDFDIQFLYFNLVTNWKFERASSNNATGEDVNLQALALVMQYTHTHTHTWDKLSWRTMRVFCILTCIKISPVSWDVAVIFLHRCLGNKQAGSRFTPQSQPEAPVSGRGSQLSAAEDSMQNNICLQLQHVAYMSGSLDKMTTSLILTDIHHLLVEGHSSFLSVYHHNTRHTPLTSSTRHFWITLMILQWFPR